MCRFRFRSNEPELPPCRITLDLLLAYKPITMKKEFRNFGELLSGTELPLLVDFYAPWCGPCQMMAQILDQVRPQFQGKLQVVKINTDNYPDLAARYHVYALPTLVLFHDGEPIDRFEGVIRPEDLIGRIKTALANRLL